MKVLHIAAALLLAGCSPAKPPANQLTAKLAIMEESCRQQGYSQGTEEFGFCMQMALAAARANAREK